MYVLVQGLGPRFRLLVHLSNEGEGMATDLLVCACALRMLARTRASRLQQAVMVLAVLISCSCAVLHEPLPHVQLLVEEADGLYRLLTRHVAVPCLVPQLQYVFKVRGGVLLCARLAAGMHARSC